MPAVGQSQPQYNHEDSSFFNGRGIALAEVTRQRSLLASGYPFRTHAVRACTVADGIRKIEGQERETLIKRGRLAAQAGRLTDFIPASGAATRMFAELIETLGKSDDNIRDLPNRQASDTQASNVLLILRSLNYMAFYPELRKEVLKHTNGAVDLDRTPVSSSLERGFGRAVLTAIVGTPGLALANRPKALIPFHRYSETDIRTALEEHLHTAATFGADCDGRYRIHFTCSPEHMESFKAEASAVAAKLQQQHKITFDVTFSIQDPSTDTVCITADGQLGRDAKGNPLLRPGGHGALLFNLNKLAKSGADIVYINNIDNVHPERHRTEFVESKYLLLGVLRETQGVMHEAYRALQVGMTSDGVEELYSELREQLGLRVNDEEWSSADVNKKSSLLMNALDRPVRVVGVVKNTGAPGGGPFWVKGSDGRVTLQLVEKHELDPNDPAQQQLFSAGTHFNPVRIMCGLRDCDGQPYELNKFVNGQAVLISEKSVGGTRVKILELPGLWNGGMAEWMTVFVEVDETTFAPVKSVVDLADQSHQG